MMRHSSKVLLALVVAAVDVANPQVTVAQGLQPVPVSHQVPALRMPTVMVSAGFGSANDPRGAEESNLKPMQMFSVQFLPTRHFVMEAEFGRWETVWDRRLPNAIYFPGGQTTISGRATPCCCLRGRRTVLRLGALRLQRTGRGMRSAVLDS